MKKTQPYKFLLLIVFQLFISSLVAQYGPLYWDLRGYDSIPDYRKAMHAFSDKKLSEAIQVLDSIENIYVKNGDFRKQYLLKNEKGAMYYVSKDYKASFNILQQNMDLMQAQHDTLNYEYCISLRLMGYLANEWKEVKTPKSVFMERQSAVLEKMKDTSAIYADCLSDLGLTYIYTDSEKGMNYLLASKKIAKKLKLTNSLLIIDNTLTNKLSIEQPNLSLQIQKRLLETASRKFYRDSISLIMLAYHVGVKSSEIGEFTEAVKYLDYASEIMAATNNPNPKLITAIPIEKIQCYSQLGNQKLFEQEVEKTLQFYYATSENKNWPEYDLLSIIGNNYLVFNADSALKFLNKAQALILLDPIEERDIETLGKTLNCQAQALQKLGKINEAIAKIMESIELYTGVNENNHPNFICSNGNDEILKETYLFAGELFAYKTSLKNNPEYLEMALKAFYCCDTIMRRLAVNISDQDAVFAYAKEYKKMTSILLDLPNFSSSLPEIAFHFVSNSKGFQLLADIKKSAFSKNYGTKDSLWIEKIRIETLLYPLKNQITESELNANNSSTDSLKIIEKDLLVDLIVVNFKIMKSQTNQEHYFDDDIEKGNISDSSMVVDIFETQNSAFIFCLTNKELSCTKVENVEKLNLLATQFYKAVKTGSDFKNIAKELSNLLLKPISDKILASKTITFIPDNILYQIPFELLPNPKTGKIMVNTHAISYHYSTSLWIKSQSKKGPQTNTLLAIAPVFENKNSEALVENFRGEHAEDPYLQKMTRENIAPLPFTLLEINDLSKLFSLKGISNTKLTNNLATKENFFNQAQNYSILHIATHGYVSKTTPSNSGFFLYTNNNAIDLLNMGELFNLNTTADLVVLSACNSGVGPIYEGEGLMALPRGFIYAGVPNVMASLWKVHDAKTKELMLLFYTYLLNGNTYSQALRKAKLDCIQKGFLPLDWAGFVLIGR